MVDVIVGSGGGSGWGVRVLVPVPALVLVLFHGGLCLPTIGFLFLFHVQLVDSMRFRWPLVVGVECSRKGFCGSLSRMLDLGRDVPSGNTMVLGVVVEIVVVVVGIDVVVVAAFAAAVVDVGGSKVAAAAAFAVEKWVAMCCGGGIVVGPCSCVVDHRGPASLKFHYCYCDYYRDHYRDHCYRVVRWCLNYHNYYCYHYNYYDCRTDLDDYYWECGTNY